MPPARAELARASPRAPRLLSTGPALRAWLLVRGWAEPHSLTFIHPPCRYGGGRRDTLYAEVKGKAILWNSEYGDGDGSGHSIAWQHSIA